MASTRGSGLLEGYLALRRARIADGLIPARHRSGRILDVGCGKDPRFLSRIEFESKCGLDQEVETCTRGDINMYQFDLSTMTQWEFEDDCFDVVTALAVVEHFPPIIFRHILSEAKRILKTRGLLVITTPAPRAQLILRLFAKLRLVSSVEIDDHKHYYGQEELTSGMERVGFGAVRAAKIQCGFNIWASGVKIS